MPIRMNNIPFKLLLIVAFSILVSCSNKNNNKKVDPNPSVAVPTLEIKKSSVTTESEYAATLQGSSIIEIRPQINGYITNIFVKEGSYVTKGQTLFEIDKRIYEADLNSAIQNKNAAASRLKAAKIELDKIAPLVNNNVVSKVQLETAKAQYSQAEAALKESETKIALAQTNLDYSIIKAPSSGFIGLISKRIGSLAKSTDAQAITVLTSTNTMYAYFSISQSDFHNIFGRLPGTTLSQKISSIPNVYLRLANGSIYKTPGRITIVNKQIDAQTGSITLRADFPNYNGILLSGGAAKVILKQNINEAIAIPIKSVLDIQDKAFVYVLDRNNKISQREVYISYRYNNLYVIASGLNVGETIVVDGLNKVSTGSTVISSKS